MEPNASAASSVAALRRALDHLRDDALAGLPPAVLGDQLIELGILAARLAYEQARRAAAFDSSGGPLADGFPSAAAWLRANSVASPSEAADLVRVGRALRDRLPATGDALREGRFGFQAAAAIVRAARDVRDPDVVAALDSTLAEIAPTLPPSHVAHAARRILEHLDPELLQRDAAQRHADRCLTLSPMLDGAVSVHGQLDEEGAAVLYSALAPMSTPHGPEDTRTAAQRRADALVELVAKAAESGAAGQVSGIGLPPTVIVRVDIATLADLGADRPGWAAARGADRPGWAAARGAADCPRVPGGQAGSRSGPAELDWGGPILRQTLERIGCGAQIVRLVADGPSKVLNLGRTRRLASPAQRVAIAARDRGCRFPGCDRKAPWADIHHAKPWSEGGATDLADLISFCRFHHRLFHEGRWSLARIPNGHDAYDPQGVLRYRIALE